MKHKIFYFLHRRAFIQVIMCLSIFAFFMSSQLALAQPNEAVPALDLRKMTIPGMTFSQPQPISLEQGRSALLQRQAELRKRKIDITKGIQVFDKNGQEVDIPEKTAAQLRLGSGQSVAEVAVLARALKNDVDLIYEYVRNNIEFMPFFGFKKGSVGSILDGQGTSWDQAYLMLSLLREAGFAEDDVEFVLGDIQVSPQEFNAWWGSKGIDATTISRHLAEAQRPFSILTEDDSDASVATAVILYHAWVRVKIDNVWYHFDPSFKSHQYNDGLNLATALNYAQADYISAAKNGAVENSNSIQNVNSQGINSYLNDLSMNLITYIKANMPNASMADIIGGSVITPKSDDKLRQTALSNVKRIDGTASNINQLASMIPFIKIKLNFFESISIPASIYQGSRMTFTYDQNNRLQFRIDGELHYTGPAMPAGSRQNITMEVDEPYPTNGARDQTTEFSLIVGASYLVVNGWGPTGRNMMEHFRQRVSQNQQDGVDANSEQSTGDTLAMFAAGYLAQGSRVVKLIEAISDVAISEHHSVGLVALADSPYIDLPMNFLGVKSQTSDLSIEKAVFDMLPGYLFGFESTVIEQMVGTDAVSTVSLFDYANQLPASNNRFFDVQCDQLNSAGDSCSNKTSYLNQIKPQLKNYSASGLANIEQHIDNGYRLILPQDGELGENDWDGYAFIGSRTLGNGDISIAYKIGNDTLSAKGGFGTRPVSSVVFRDKVAPSLASIFNDGLNNDNYSAVGDPISWQTGDFFSDYTDITIGSAGYPFGLAFSRSYNSAARLRNGDLGWGWNHNYNLNATLNSDGFQGLGEDSPIDAAAAISAIFVTLDLMKTDRQLDKMVILTLTQQWLMDQLTNNLVLVTQPGKGEQFVLLPDGSYNPPPGSASELSKTADGSYHYLTKEGIELDFNLAGQAEQWRNANGVTVDFNYTDERLSSVSNAFGHQLTLSYNGDNKITGVADGTGRSVSYSYDDNSNLTSYADIAGEDTTYQYDQPGRMTRFFNPDLPTTPVVINVYDALGRVKTQTNVMGQIYHYYFAGKRSEEEDPLSGSQVRYFDDKGLELRSIDKLGHQTINQYDAHHRLIKTTLPEGNSTEVAYDNRHNPITVTVSPKPCSPQPCTNLLPLVTQRSYDLTFNQPLTITDTLGRVTTNTYNDTGSLLSTALPAVINPDSGVLANPTTHYTYNSEGQVLTVTDPIGLVSSNSYDAVTGDLLSTTVDAGPNKLNLTASFSYDAVSNQVTSTDANGHQSTFQFDAMRRVTRHSVPAPIDMVVETDYDKMGRVVEVRRGPADNPYQVTRTSYTPMGKVASITSPDNSVISNSYDVLDRLELVTDALGRKSQSIYNVNGQVLQVKRAVGTPLEQVYQTHTYSPNGLPLSISDAKGNRTDFEYDSFSRLVRTYYPKPGTVGQSNPADYVELGHDGAGNIVSQRTRAGQVITFAFDSLNRLITKTVPGAQVTQSFYDLAGRTVEVTSSDGQSVSNRYDAAGRIEQVNTRLPSGRHLLVSYQFDAADNRTRITWPDGYFINYEYDELNRMTKVKENDTLLAAYQYDDLSRRSSLTYGNGGKVTYDHALDNALTDLDHDFSGNGSKTLEYDYGYNVANQLTSLKLSDSAYMGGPVATQSTNYSANGLNQYSEIGGVSVSHDNNGNLTDFAFNGESHQYTYNAENILIGAITPANNSIYRYGPMNRRVAKNVNQGAIHIEFLHDSNETIAEYNGADGTLLHRYIYGPGVDERIARIQPDGSREFYYLNHQGSTVAVADDAGGLTASFNYDPFGNSANASTGNPYRFTGRRLDPETGLYYYRARYYSPDLGRFLQTDPLGYGDGMNMYAYVGNSPVMFTDPQGLERQGAGDNFNSTNSADFSLTSGFSSLWDDENLINSGVQILGAGVFFAEKRKVYNNQWRGKNGLFYDIKWGGNGTTGGRNRVVRAANRLSKFGKVIGFAGAVNSGYQFHNDRSLKNFSFLALDVAGLAFSTVGFVINSPFIGYSAGKALAPYAMHHLYIKHKFPEVADEVLRDATGG